MVEADIPKEMLTAFKAFSENVDYAFTNYELFKGHEGQYAAIGNRAILGFSEDRGGLEEEFKQVNGLFIELITPENLHWIL